MYILNKREENTLKKIIKYARYDYLRNNNLFSEMEDIELYEIPAKDNLEFQVMNNCDIEVQAQELEMIFTEKNIFKAIKALTYKDKLVLFLYYVENITDKEIAELLKVNRNTICQQRKRIIKKIIGGCDNV